MAFEGTLKDVGLTDILQLISMQKNTGILAIGRGKEMVTVCFVKGQVVFADEFQRSEQERLGAILLKSKLLSPQDLLKAAEIQKQTLQKLGFILVNNGFISHAQLRDALQTQVKETVFKLFRWEEGDFKFSQEPVTYDQTIYQSLPTDFMVMEGIRRIDEWPIIKKKITSLEMVFDRVEGAEEKIGDGSQEDQEEDLDNILSFVEEGGGAPPPGETPSVKLSSSERIVFSLIDGHRTVQDLVDEGRMGEFETSKALFSILSMGVIKSVAEVSRPVVEEGRRWDGRILKRAGAGLVILALFFVLLMVNPLGMVRVWPSGKDALSSVGGIGDNFRLEKIQFALMCYYLERQSYPPALGSLVDGDFLAPGDAIDHQGNEFLYLREREGYSLRSPAGFRKEQGL